MKPERWEQASRIFESALALSQDERAAYLREQCGADESLRQEVESLIAAHGSAAAAGFIDAPAVEDLAPLLADAADEPGSERLREGQEFGSYLILKQIGAGGMGEVYLATDTRLNRKVALKILAEDLASDRRRMQRFAQEARVASALNQPNILTVYEFGETDSLHFLATEYIEGKTLREHLRAGQLKLSEILDFSAQIVAALEAAHEASIVHRDIKPENVMIRKRDHVVKVLDFGLAKLTEKAVSTMSGTETDTEALTEFKTAPGSVLGTITYMSPEQAQGLALDERSDIWSTGVVIYEMAAGHVPFKGATSSHTVVDILEKDAPPLSRSARPDVPDELERIVRKTLAKDRAQRYQTASDLLIDLRNLKKRLEVESEIQRSAPAGFIRSAKSDTREQPTPKTQELTTEKPKLSKPIALSLFALILILAAGFGIRAWLKATAVGVSAPPPDAAAGLLGRQLSYWITVQKYREGKPFENPFRLAGEINFEKDYRVRLHLRSSEAGYLYIINESPAGDNPLQILFPSTTSNDGSASVGAKQEIQIPERSWFQFDAEQGTETVWLVWSSNALETIEAAKRFANPTDRGVISDVALSRSLKQLLTESASLNLKVEKTETPPQTALSSREKVIVHAIKLSHN